LIFVVVTAFTSAGQYNDFEDFCFRYQDFTIHTDFVVLYYIIIHCCDNIILIFYLLKVTTSNRYCDARKFYHKKKLVVIFFIGFKIMTTILGTGREKSMCSCDMYSAGNRLLYYLHMSLGYADDKLYSSDPAPNVRTSNGFCFANGNRTSPAPYSFQTKSFESLFLWDRMWVVVSGRYTGIYIETDLSVK